MQLKLVQVLCIGQCNHSCIVWTRRQFREINSVFVAQEEFYSPQAITCQRTSHLLCHLLSLSQMFRCDMSRLETFTVVTTFLHVSDRRTEQSRTILLCHGQQGNLTVKVNKLFYNEFLNIPTASAASVFPRILQVFLTLGYRLSLTRRRHQRFDDTRIANLSGSFLQFFIRRSVKILCRLQSQFLRCQITDSLTVHRKIHRTGTWYNLYTFFFQVIKPFSTNCFYFRNNYIRTILFYHTVQSFSIQHTEYLACICHLHSRCTCIRVTRNYILSQTLGSNGKFLSEFPGTQQKYFFSHIIIRFMLLSAKIIFFLGPYTTAGRFIKPRLLFRPASSMTALLFRLLPKGLRFRLP